MRVGWRLLLVGAAVAGIVCTWVSIRTPWVYFTVQSNLILALYYGWRLLGRETSATIKGAVTLYLVITGLVAHFTLGHGANPLPLLAGGTRQIGNFLLHYVTPVMALTDWLAFDRDRRPRWADPLIWLAFPLVYGAFVLLRAPTLPVTMSRRYVYPFLDVDRLGWSGFTLAGLALAGTFVAMGYLLVGLHRFAALDRRKPGTAIPDSRI
ncbi:Pr6Pr family membrane protein [Nonomuraea sp. NEAU-A123]|uniref:Pr6Pr family membrane protein n=1 Tax=Nonomuraea sp. NEAU-A123 TaxID=2839649 RepID=UPI001BE4130D|nr:Pr6Pr family membrane protein [Nonomuraea sp. NEAU-A123]MBT2235107.1 Pr6Pr family membrane protein [Nonomuraea sp. NEAU-A123]